MENKIIIFDMDGVLFDTIPFAQKSFLATHPGMTEEMYKEIHSGNCFEEAKKFSHFYKIETEEEKKDRQKQYSEIKSRTPMFKGIRELLKELHKKGYILILNTNAYERNCLPLLENSGIKSIFNLIASGELSKDKVEKFRLIEDKYNADKKDLLFITDALGDIKDADIAGIRTIAVTWGVHNKAFFEREKHSNLIEIVDTVKELGDFIKKH